MPIPNGAPSLVQVLEERQDKILARFVAQVRQKQLSPADVARPLLVDHIPKFLADVVRELSLVEELRFSQDAIDTSGPAREHGGQRWSLGYDMNGLIREYGILRHCIVQEAKDAGVLFSLDEFDVLAKCLSVGVAEAVEEYGRFRDQELGAQKANLEFLAEAGQLLSSSLDYRSTLSRLTTLIVPTLADWCSVQLDAQPLNEMRIAHTDPSKIALLRELYERFPFPSDARCGYPHVARSGEPEFVPEVDAGLLETIAQSPEHLALLRELNVCSWMILPLRVQGHLFGAITLAYSDSKRHYTEQQLAVAVDLARRAAVAIDNARLYDLSQKERSRVEAVTRAKDEFVAMLSHELRTPLNAILGWIRLVREGSLPDEKREHALTVIERNAQAQDRLVADLLDISRVIVGEVQLEVTDVNFANLVEMVIDGVRPAADAKNIQIQAEIEHATAVLRGDGDRLQQVVWNLLTNAVKFTPRDGTIAIALHQIDADVELRVQDSGDGITLDFLPHVFETFRQSDSSVARRHGGLGIGLSIARHIVELHGGVVEARSQGAGQGATFTVRLPMNKWAGAGPPVPPISVTDGALLRRDTSELQGLRALVVEDDPDARDLIAHLLETNGMETRLATSVAEALAALETYTPDVILSDIGMPGEDGYALIRRIRMLPSAKSAIPAIALTAFAGEADRTRALVEGFNRHIAKPIELTELIRAVGELAGTNLGGTGSSGRDESGTEPASP